MTCKTVSLYLVHLKILFFVCLYSYSPLIPMTLFDQVQETNHTYVNVNMKVSEPFALGKLCMNSLLNLPSISGIQ